MEVLREPFGHENGSEEDEVEVVAFVFTCPFILPLIFVFLL